MGIDVARFFHPEALVKVVDGVAVSLECYRAVFVPLEEQRPVIRVIPPQIAEAVHALVVAEPTAVPTGCVVTWCQTPAVLAVQTAQTLFDTELHQRRPFPFVQLAEPGRLVRCDADVLHDISFLAPRGALLGEGVCPLAA